MQHFGDFHRLGLGAVTGFQEAEDDTGHGERCAVHCMHEGPLVLVAHKVNI